MENHKVSVILPSVNPEKWPDIYNQLLASMGKYSFELIAIGPYTPNSFFNNIKNFKYIRDFGSPSRCFQIASLLVESEYLCWCSDDYLVVPNAFEMTLDQIEKMNIEDDGINLLYSEGQNFTGTQHIDLNYWTTAYHSSFKVPGVNQEWKIFGAFMVKLKTWKKFGGLDCRFEHVNMNTHDFSFAIQNNGGRIINSPCRVYMANWSPWPTEESLKGPIQLAWEQNDEQLFKNLYSNPNYINERNIDINNWKNSPSVWPRRFKIN